MTEELEKELPSYNDEELLIKFGQMLIANDQPFSKLEEGINNMLDGLLRGAIKNEQYEQAVELKRLRLLVPKVVKYFYENICDDCIERLIDKT